MTKQNKNVSLLPFHFIDIFVCSILIVVTPLAFQCSLSVLFFSFIKFTAFYFLNYSFKRQLFVFVGQHYILYFCLVFSTLRFCFEVVFLASLVIVIYYYYLLFITVWLYLTSFYISKSIFAFLLVD